MTAEAELRAILDGGDATRLAAVLVSTGASP